ncbi:TPA: glutamyl-tRNA reductase [Candidatus Poribacteria bacterium]|nr:glutamyl-tRNA reductase [Candidatus Poribacteria bacterium]
MGLPIELKVEGKRVLIVGGGKVAARKFLKILKFNPSLLRVVAREISHQIKERAKGSDRVEVIEREFRGEDVLGFDLVFVATDDGELNRRVAESAGEKGALVNVADHPELCDFYMPAFIKRDELNIAVSTGGLAPSFSAQVKRVISEKLPLETLSESLRTVSKVRRELVEKGFGGRRDLIRALSADHVDRAVCGRRRGIYLVGFSHKTSPIHIREKALRVLSSFEGQLEESVLLSTCNRVELYFCDEGFERVLEDVPDELKDHLYFRRGREVFQHLALVASGCDSLALGETQIAGQVKRAYEEARGKGRTGKILNRLFERALKASKEIRVKTGIQESSVSVPSLAVKLAEEKLSGLSDRKVGILGTGEVAEILLKNLNPENLYLIGRNRERLASLCGEHNAEPVHLSKLETVLGELNLLFVATSSPTPLLRREQVERAIRGRKLLIIDLSVPRNVEEDVRRINGVECLFVDELKRIASENLKKKEERLKEAKRLARIEAEKFKRWYENLEAEEVVISLLRKLEEIPAEKLLKEAIKRVKRDRELALAFKEIFGL